MTPYETGFDDDDEADDRYAHYVAIAHAAAAFHHDHMPAGPAKPAPTPPSEAPVRAVEASRTWIEVEPPSIYQAGFKYVERPEPAGIRAAGIIALIVLGLLVWFNRPQPGDPPSIETPGVEEMTCGHPYPDGC